MGASLDSNYQRDRFFKKYFIWCLVVKALSWNQVKAIFKLLYPIFSKLVNPWFLGTLGARLGSNKEGFFEAVDNSE